MNDESSSLGDLGVKKRALLALKELQSRLDAVERARTEPIAIIGMGCRFPGGADDPEAFWRLLAEGRSAVGEVPADRWDVEACYDPNPDAPGKTYSRHGAFLDAVDRFDAAFFGIAPREAVSMDPQQRLLLEVAWEALEGAGQAPHRLSGSQTGVFLGISNNDYATKHIHSGDLARIDSYSGTGYAFSVAAGRISYLLGLQGPSIAVDTACSSSLVAVHLACQSLRAGECALALAAGVNLILAPEVTVYLSQAKALSPSGMCRTFDAAADGYVRGEGCGVVVLKRLSDALAANDPILALIRGSAVNQDGRSNGLTAPNSLAQQAVIRQALANGGVAPQQISYVEAHGTGTPLGDPIEVQALAAALAGGRAAEQPLTIGSVKTNIGHLEAAAGLAGLIKVVLALHHEQIPPHLHLARLNPHIALDGQPIRIPTAPVAWQRTPLPRFAGVSSFGFSGTNAHIVVQEAPPANQAASDVDRPWHILALSARHERALRELAGRFAQHLAQHPDASLADICYSAATGRAQGAHRLAVVARSTEHARAQLATAEGQSRRNAGAPRVAFLFTGQGSQYGGMGWELHRSAPVFRAALEECGRLVGPQLDRPLLELLEPRAGAEEALGETRYTQPALVALGYALSEQWRSWGVRPGVVLGHSVGEITAACVAGALSLPDALRLAAARGRLMHALPRTGAMAAVFAELPAVAQAIEPYGDALAIAAINGPSNIVISGTRAALEAALAELQRGGIKVRRLNTSHAFHSSLMEPILDQLAHVASGVTHAAPRIGLISTLSGRPVPVGEPLTADYWRRQARQPVQFAAAMQTLRDEGYDLVVEVGPDAVLLPMAQRCLPDYPAAWLPSLRRGSDDWQQMLQSLGALFERGVDVDWAGFDRPYSRRHVALPSYPWQRERYWLDSPEARQAHQAAQWLYEVEWQERPAPPPRPAAGERWLIVGDEEGVGRELAQLLERHGAACQLLAPDAGGRPAQPSPMQQALRALGDNAPAGGGVVYLRPLTLGEPASYESPADDVATRCDDVLRLVQEAAALQQERQAAGLRLWIATCNAQPAAPAARPIDITQAPLWGLGRTIALEHPELWGGLVDLGPDLTPAQAAAALFQELYGQGDDQVAWHGGRRRVARLAQPRRAGAPVRQLRPDAAYLVTGGLGSLGLQSARWLAGRGARHLVLVGRHDPLPAAAETLRELERSGVRLLVARCDVSHAEQVAALLADAREAMPPLRGVIHAAGTLDDGVLLRQDRARFERVLAPKVAGAWHLHRLTRDLALDFMLFFSSAAALLGAAGQGNYAAANSFLDALAHHRRALGLPATSVNWGPWAGAGMAGRSDDGGRPRAARGMQPLEPDQALAALELIMGRNVPQVAALPFDWARYLEPYAGGAPQLFAAIAERVGLSAAPAAEPALRQRLAAARPAERRELLLAFVEREVARALGFDQPHPLPPQQGFFELGMDSLMALELKNRIQAQLGLPLRSTLTLDHPTVEALAAHLAQELSPERGAADAPRPAPPSASQAQPAELGQLSEHELVALLAQELDSLDTRNTP